MKLTQRELDGIVIPYNFCLIKLDQSYSQLLHNWYEYQLGETKIQIDTSFNPAKHAPRHGLLIKAPKDLIYENGNMDTIGWKTEVDVMEGDLVWFDYLACLTALGKLANPISVGENPTWFRVDEDTYVLMRYDALIFSWRESVIDSSFQPGPNTVIFFGKYGDITCLNGNVIMQPIFDDIESSNLIIPEHLKKKENRLKCMVIFVGKANREYLDGSIDSDQLKQGDLVVLKNYKLRLENDLSAMLAPGLVFIQQNRVWAILKDQIP